MKTYEYYKEIFLNNDCNSEVFLTNFNEILKSNNIKNNEINEIIKIIKYIINNIIIDNMIIIEEIGNFIIIELNHNFNKLFDKNTTNLGISLFKIIVLYIYKLCPQNFPKEIFNNELTKIINNSDELIDIYLIITDYVDGESIDIVQFYYKYWYKYANINEIREKDIKFIIKFLESESYITSHSKDLQYKYYSFIQTNIGGKDSKLFNEYLDNLKQIKNIFKCPTKKEVTLKSKISAKILESRKYFSSWFIRLYCEFYYYHFMNYNKFIMNEEHIDVNEFAYEKLYYELINVVNYLQEFTEIIKFTKIYGPLDKIKKKDIYYSNYIFCYNKEQEKSLTSGVDWFDNYYVPPNNYNYEVDEDVAETLDKLLGNLHYFDLNFINNENNENNENGENSKKEQLKLLNIIKEDLIKLNTSVSNITTSIEEIIEKFN